VFDHLFVVKNASHRDYCVSVALTDPISAAVRHFETGGLHRVGVVDARGELVNVLTQSDVVAWAAQGLFVFFVFPYFVVIAIC
jgi:CBS-domain-containing membrane protein